MESGYFRLGRFGGAPIRVHWTAPLGAILFSSFRFAPAAWAAFILLILIHELGHAALVRRFHLVLESIDVQGMGGVCRYYGTTTPIRRALIAWGGVFAQFIAFVIAFGISFALPPGLSHHWADAMDTFVRVNLIIIGINLLPIPGFDGAEAWKLFGRNGLGAWWRARDARKQAPPSAPRGIVRPMQPRRRFISNDISEDILENTPTSTKRPPPHMLN